MNKSYLFFCFVLFLTSCTSNISLGKKLPEGFVYLYDVDSTILQSPRYATKNNFLGKKVAGYKVKKIVCTNEAALALKAAQAEMLKEGYRLAVYDGYRPQRASADFVNWVARVSEDKIIKSLYYPTISKQDMFAMGYVGKKSAHSRGSTFDLTITKINKVLDDIRITKKKLNNGEIIPFLDDGTIDMGSSFDLFHPVSHHDTNLITAKQTEKRNFLRNLMKKHGFKEYQQEWWHYTLENEPYPNTYFDFVVTE